MKPTVRVVYDCMIFLQAAARPSRVHGTMRLLRERRVLLCVSPQAVAEVRDVLTRPDVTAKFPALTSNAVDVFLAQILSEAKLVQPVQSHFSLPRDKKDEPYVNLAIQADAEFLVTWNDRHLSYLMRGDTPEGQDFCRRFPRLTIADPPAFVNAIRSRET
jgi:putative PIN family toxin of toxin-antitoxin system